MVTREMALTWTQTDLVAFCHCWSICLGIFCFNWSVYCLLDWAAQSCISNVVSPGHLIFCSWAWVEPIGSKRAPMSIKCFIGILIESIEGGYGRLTGGDCHSAKGLNGLLDQTTSIQVIHMYWLISDACRSPRAAFLLCWGMGFSSTECSQIIPLLKGLYHLSALSLWGW